MRASAADGAVVMTRNLRRTKVLSFSQCSLPCGQRRLRCWSSLRARYRRGSRRSPDATGSWQTLFEGRSYRSCSYQSYRRGGPCCATVPKPPLLPWSDIVLMLPRDAYIWLHNQHPLRSPSGHQTAWILAMRCTMAILQAAHVRQLCMACLCRRKQTRNAAVALRYRVCEQRLPVMPWKEIGPAA